ncbi:single-stranded DNA-binding protein [Corynebacterium freiburgense]|uniref:single-stranded DNA-binding protein n=1 Tax=Corynebacterium freiburgense TaxID=556548 RepID=UPI0004182FDC|nr:single-stranded DNA-binding protein [Corynebacterium freiburgense]WJZ03925.1 Single-stranded DNA-binding protein [Corynebacterium freiburgense]
MALGETNITVVGNLVADPELRFTPSGAAVANFRIASTPRRRNPQTNQWEDGEAMYLTCNVWRQMAENVAESLSKGMRVIVTGRLRQRSYETREGERRSNFEIEVDDIGPSLTFATAQVTRASRSNQGGYGSQGSAPAQQPAQNQGGFGGGFSNAGNQPQQPAQHQGGFGGQQGGYGANNTPTPDNDPWNSAPAAGGYGGPADDEPPF